MANPNNTAFNKTITALIYRLQQQDKQALKQLYDECSTRLLTIIIRILNDPHEAEDVLQDTFVKLWHQSHKYSGTGSAWGWLCVMARNAAIDKRRSLGHQPLSIEEEPSLLETLTSETHVVLDHYGVERCLQQLKERPRQAVLLAFVQGHSHSELAQQLSAPLGTVKAWVRRGLQELRQCLDT